MELQYTYLGSTDQTTGPVLITPTMLDLQWHSVILYPAGYYARDIQFLPRVTLPTGWKYATALEGATVNGDSITFAAVALDSLIDSPLMAAHYLKQVVLSTQPVPVRFDIAADDADGLTLSSEQLEGCKRVVAQAYKLFGSHHYDHYDQMLWLSDELGPVYYEHHRSGENSGPANLLKQKGGDAPGLDYLIHGYVHSWNGMFRRPAEMFTPNFNTPERDSMLWVFEGLTMYWEAVLSARSGMWTHQDALDHFSDLASTLSTNIGSEWRPLEDVNNDPLVAGRKAESWSTWQENMFDAYSEGEMIWFDVDTLIRERSQGTRSLDDFARSFFGLHSGSYATEPYTFEEMVAALNAITPYDWKGFLRSRLEDYGASYRLDALTRAGYMLAYTDKQTPPDAGGVVIDLKFSLGMRVTTKGRILGVHWEGPAFNAGLIPGGTITSINGQPFNAKLLQAAIVSAQSGGPLNLMVKHGSTTESFSLEWRGGPRYPYLERIPEKPAMLDAILAARQ